jgi:hypothetical protein
MLRSQELENDWQPVQEQGWRNVVDDELAAAAGSSVVQRAHKRAQAIQGVNYLVAPATAAC